MMEKQLASENVKYKQEATLTKKVKDFLSGQPDVCFYKASDRYHKGISDIVACVGGIFVAIELKKDGGITTPHQQLYIEQIKRAGGVGGVCQTVAEVRALLVEARERN